jgi:SAM-dependent methyltransferase
MTGSVTRWIDKRFFAEFDNNWDDMLLRERILARLLPQHHVLDLGAGAGIISQMNFRGLCTRICGVDLDPRVVTNPMLDEGRVADAGKIPYEDAAFDLVFADNVLEHLEDPRQVFSEIARVLKPGGHFLFKTPNRWHYMPLIARFTPHWFHGFVNRLRGRAVVDTFPTKYRANDPDALRQLAAQAGFFVERVELIEGRPEYLRISWPTYLIGLAYERLVNSSELLAPLRILCIGEFTKMSGLEKIGDRSLSKQKGSPNLRAANQATLGNADVGS